MITIEQVCAMLEGAAYDEDYNIIAITAGGITNYFNSNLECIDCRTHNETIQKVHMLDTVAKSDLADFLADENEDIENESA